MLHPCRFVSCRACTAQGYRGKCGAVLRGFAAMDNVPCCSSVMSASLTLFVGATAVTAVATRTMAAAARCAARPAADAASAMAAAATQRPGYLPHRSRSRRARHRADRGQPDVGNPRGSIYRKAEGRARGRQRERESGNRSGRAEGAGVKGLDRPAGGSIQNGSGRSLRSSVQEQARACKLLSQLAIPRMRR